ncbi:MAG: hypothetical protein P8008_00900 [Gammaproteobacteria bacterium]
MTWAQRLKRRFGLDIETCPACGRAVRVSAYIEDPAPVEKILTHLDAKAPESDAARRLPLPSTAALVDGENSAA